MFSSVLLPNSILRVAALLLAFALCCSHVVAQLPAPPRVPPRVPLDGSQEVPGDGYLDLNLNGTVSLTKLVEAVSQDLGIRFLYSADLADRQVTVYTPARMPQSALPVLLGSLLKGEELAIVDSDVPGWKRIVDVAEMVAHAPPGEAEDVLRRDGPAAAVTQVIPVNNADITKLSTILRPFISKKGASLIPLPEDKVVVVTDYVQNVRRVAEIIKLVDRPKGKAVIEFYSTVARTPASLIEQVELLISDSRDPKAASDVRLYDDSSGRRVVVAGDSERVAEVIRLLKQLDSGSDFVTRVYRLQNITAERVDKLIRGFVSSTEAEKAIETTLDEEGNLLIVRTTAGTHRQIEELLKELDQPADSSESPIRFYKLRNANAVEVLFSLLALQQVTGGNQFAQAGGFNTGAFGTLGGLNAGGVNGFGGIVPIGFGASGFAGAANQSTRLPLQVNDTAAASLDPSANQNSALGSLIGGGGANAAGAGGFGASGFGLGAGQVATLPGGARVSADAATNSLIVYAPANVQPLYEKLIKSLDQRRPQVMIEADIVAVDTSNNFSLGVEISGGDRSGAKRLFKFTSFGLSEVDATTGALTISPGTGFNGVLVDPDVADVIVRALSQHTRSRVLASPKILVNDNQPGTLDSVASVPFQSVNAADTVATTSLGGSQEAGTKIEVTPHINEDDNLQLEFSVEFSSFVGAGVGGLPPPRQVDSISSVVTIPDGKTIVVGGLKRTNEANSFTGLPWAERIPIIRELTSLQSRDHSTTSFFVFLRPKILRDSRFRDLRYLSDVDIQRTQIPGDHPKSHPLLIPCQKLPKPHVIHPTQRVHP